jgi:hypothetical protein
MGSPAPQGNAMSDSDVAILRALALQKKMDSGTQLTREDFRLVERHQLRPIRSTIDAESEWMVASGACRVLVWDSPGDGSFAPSSSPVVFTGLANRQGMNFAMGAVAGNLAANVLGSRKARRDAQPRWMEYIPYGVVTVSTHGFYVETQDEGLLVWGWGNFDTVEWIGPSAIEMLMHTDQGSVRMRLLSDWAELVFISWVQVCFQEHPGKYSWLTPDWAERVRSTTGIDPFTDRPAAELDA